jgi:hypothetical protein
MHIPRTLLELHRGLVPGWGEFRLSFPAPNKAYSRILVFLNGIGSSSFGNVISLGRVAESCQTSAGMRIALRRAGFTAASFCQEERRFFVEARREGAPSGQPGRWRWRSVA